MNDKKEKVKKFVEDIVKDKLNEAIFSRYVECPGCGNLILLKNGKCNQCGLVFDSKRNKWIKMKKDENEEDEFDFDIEDDEEEEEDEENEEENENDEEKEE